MTSNVYREAKNSQEHLLSEKKARKTFKTLKGFRRKYSKNAFLGHLNVNSQRNKFESLIELIKELLVFSSRVRVSLTPVFLIANFRYLATA